MSISDPQLPNEASAAQRLDWIEVAKREKVITDEKLNANITCG